MKTTIIHLSLALLAGSIATAREKGAPRGHRPPPLIAVLDADRDGVISAAEIQNAATALLELDKNNDGQLTPEEIHPGGRPPQGDGRPPHGGPEGPSEEPAEAE